tara:strand:+ start:510 stop:1523 length:1014 start_codon:yes stop_codon:yes gene_type:complete
MSDLLKEAIADAKAVRETALQNAKMALEEAFTPHLKSMLSAKLAEEDEDEDENPFADKEEDEEESAEEGMHDSPRREDDDEEMEVDEMDHEDEEDEEVDESTIIEIDGVKYAPIVSEDEHEDEDEEDMDESEELDLESVIKELEEELNETESDDEDSVNEEEVVTEAEHDDEDEDKDEVDEQSTSSGIGSGTSVKQPSAGDEEDPGKGKVHESVEAIQSELKEYKEAVTFLRDKLHEVNILNAKLLYTNRLFKEFVLSNDQKLKIVETFDRAQTTREIKLVYSTLAESYNDNGPSKKKDIKEFASKKAGTTAPKTKIISEEVEVADRFRKLAGLIKS